MSNYMMRNNPSPRNCSRECQQPMPRPAGENRRMSCPVSESRQMACPMSENRRMADNRTEDCRMARPVMENRRMAGSGTEDCRMTQPAIENRRMAGSGTEDCRMARPAMENRQASCPASEKRRSEWSMENRAVSFEAMSQMQLLNCINEVSFAVSDILLYLDTHPDDRAALAYSREMIATRKEAMAVYTRRFTPLTIDSTNDAESCRWEWVMQPWPWEPMAKGGCR